MNGFLMVLGIFLMTCGAVAIGSVVYTKIRELFEDGNDEIGIALIFLIIIGILGFVIFLLAYNAQVTAAALDNIHFMFPEATNG